MVNFEEEHLPKEEGGHEEAKTEEQDGVDFYKKGLEQIMKHAKSTESFNKEVKKILIELGDDVDGDLFVKAYNSLLKDVSEFFQKLSNPEESIEELELAPEDIAIGEFVLDPEDSSKTRVSPPDSSPKNIPLKTEMHIPSIRVEEPVSSGGENDWLHKSGRELSGELGYDKTQIHRGNSRKELPPKTELRSKTDSDSLFEEQLVETILDASNSRDMYESELAKIFGDKDLPEDFKQNVSEILLKWQEYITGRLEKISNLNLDISDFESEGDNFEASEDFIQSKFFRALPEKFSKDLNISYPFEVLGKNIESFFSNIYSALKEKPKNVSSAMDSLLNKLNKLDESLGIKIEKPISEEKLVEGIMNKFKELEPEDARDRAVELNIIFGEVLNKLEPGEKVMGVNSKPDLSTEEERVKFVSADTI